MAKKAAPRLTVLPDIARARTLPKAFYTDDNLFEESKERLFAPSWQFIGDAGMLEPDHTSYPFTLFEGFMDEPLVLTRDGSGKLRCLSNVCTHRGNLVADKAGASSTLRCRYHGRTFGLDGKCRSMPEFEGVHGFPAASDNLRGVPVFQWGRFIFISLMKKRNPAVVFSPLFDRMSWLSPERLVFSGFTKDYTVDAHWALYCENYLEGFHIPFVHAGLNEAIDYRSYATELLKHGCIQVAYARNGVDHFDLPPSSPDFGKKIAAYYFYFFPNLMFNFYPWGLSVNVVKPVSTNRSTVSFLNYVMDPSRQARGAGADLDTVEEEDEEVVSNVQRGIRSRFYDRGRYSVKREQGVHHFHRLVAAAMRG